ncbi:MAG: glycosyltransferase family 9 protein [Bacteroidia bacterium]|nr:glycosyltransferase family 9 protein [Bacteroidia bacterium]
MNLLNTFSRLNIAIREPFRLRNALQQFKHDAFFIKLLTTQSIVENTLLLLRLDDIGDYLLFRNALNALKKTAKYKHYKVTLCGNLAWKSIYEFLDKNAADEVIWIDKGKWKTEAYRFEIYTLVASKGFAEVAGTSFVRNFTADDLIAKASGAPKSIGWSLGYTKMPMQMTSLRADSFNTTFVSQNEGLFESLRNIEFISMLSGENITVKENNFKSAKQTDSIVLFPGASKGSKRWPAKNFATVASILSDETGFDIVIAGSESDKQQARELKVNLKRKVPVKDMTGNTTLPELIKLISGARLLITNDTVALHIADQTKTPAVCIANGVAHWRYTDYSKINPDIVTVLPAAFEKKLKESDGTYRKTTYNSSEIKLVKIAAVLYSARSLISRKY